MAEHSGILGIIFNEKDPDKLSLLLHRNPELIDFMTDYTAETTYNFLALQGEKKIRNGFMLKLIEEISKRLGL